MKNINDFFVTYKESAWQKDVNTMIDLYDNDVVIFDMWDKGLMIGLKQWSVVITDWLTCLKDERVNVSFEMMDVNEGGNVAFASAIIQYQAISAENTVMRSMKNRISVGFVKSNGTWKVKHQHTSAPVDGELKAILDI